MEILPEDKTRARIQYEIKIKEQAQEKIAKKYCGGSSKDKESIKWCLYSISDNFSFLNSNRKPIDMMILYLKEYVPLRLGVGPNHSARARVLSTALVFSAISTSC